MSKKVRRETRERTALWMAVYTLLLALGAAMPLAASYQPALHAADADGPVEVSRYIP